MLLSRGMSLCVSGKDVPWSTHWDIRVLVPMSYLKPWNCIYHPSVPSCLSRRRRRRRRRFLSIRPSVRPSRRPFRRRRRPVVSPRRCRRPVSVRPSRRSVVPSDLCPSVRSSRVIRLIITYVTSRSVGCRWKLISYTSRSIRFMYVS